MLNVLSLLEWNRLFLYKILPTNFIFIRIILHRDILITIFYRKLHFYDTASVIKLFQRTYKALQKL